MSKTSQTDFAVSRCLNGSDGIECLIELSSRLEQELAEAKAEVTQLNGVLRAAGWGQGEIDNAACVEEENAKLRAELAALREELAAVRSGSAKVIRNFREDIAALREAILLVADKTEWKRGAFKTAEEKAASNAKVRAAIDAARKVL